MIRLYGTPLSPFVRKVMFTLNYKGLNFDHEHTFPGDESPEFRAISPLGKIPVLEHDGFTIPDSSVICRYLDRISPEKSIYPTDPQLEAQACWIEEYADTRLIENCGGLFRERLLHPRLLNQATNDEVVQNILEESMPACLAYLETLAPESGYFVGDSLSIADFAVTTCFIQARYGDFDVDGSVAPKLRSYLDGAFANPLVAAQLDAEKNAVPGLLD